MKITPRARELYGELAQGWNTWDVHSVVGHVFLPDGFEVSFSVIIPDKGGYCREFSWPEVTRFGEHAMDGSYTDVDVCYEGSSFRVETASDGPILSMKVTPINVTGGEYVAFEAHGQWGDSWNIAEREGTIVAGSLDRNFVIDTLSETVVPDWNPIQGANIVVKPGSEAIYLRVNAEGMTEEDIDAFIAESREAWLASTITADGDLGEALDGMRRVILWNTIYDARNRRVVAPVSRNWCRGYGYTHYGMGPYALFDWDTFFAGLMAGLIDKRLAYAFTFSILEEITPEGFIPNLGGATRHSRDRSEPQVGSWCVWKLYLQFGDTWFIEECFDRLLEWNNWRFRERDCNGDGLLELASTPWDTTTPGRQWPEKGVGEKQGAMWESGLDNSPMFDDATFNEEKHCMELSYAGLCAEMVADCECLAKIARVIGRDKEAAELESRGKRLGELINSELWCEEKGTYLNKHWNGEFSPSMSPTNTFPLMAGIVPEDRARRIIDEHILNPNEFWGDYVIPMISRDDPSFETQDYWRGRIWAPTNFLTNEGIRRAGRSEVAAKIAGKGLAMFLTNWRENGNVCENYNAITGYGAEKGGSDRFYHWGAMLAYIGVQEYFDMQAWDDCIKLGGVHTPPGTLRNVPFRGRKISVTVGKDSCVHCQNGSIHSTGDSVAVLTPDELETFVV